MNLRLLVIAAASVAMAGAAMAQKSTSPRPKWLNQLPTPTNSTFRYECHTVEAPTLEGARSMAINQAVGNSGMKNGVVVMSETLSKRKLKQHWVNGVLNETYDIDTDHKTEIKDSPQSLYLNRVAEYWEYRNGRYYYTVAFAKSDLGTAPLFDNVVVTRNYGARGLWRSMIIPGWGQIYKGSTLKGCSILGATALCAVGITVAENQRADYVKKIKHTHDSSLIKSYRTKRDHWATGRNVCIGACAALYVYNLIDALVAPGAERLVVHNYGRDGGRYAVFPVAGIDGSLSLSASLTF